MYTTGGKTPFSPVFQNIVKELFSQFGTVLSVELNDHPGLPRDSGPNLSKHFKVAAKQVSRPGCRVCVTFRACRSTECNVSFLFVCPSPPQCFKVGYIVFHASSSLAAAKSHPHDVPLVVSSEQHPVSTGVKSKWQVKFSFSTCGSFVFTYSLVFCVHLSNYDETVNPLTPPLLASRTTEWIHKYKASFIETKKLQELVDSFMVDYDKRKEEVRPWPARTHFSSERRFMSSMSV